MVNSIKKVVSRVRAKLPDRVSLALIMSVAAVAVIAGLIVSVKTITVRDGEKLTKVSTYSNDSSIVLANAGIELAENDEMTVDGDGNITVTRKFPVTLIAEGANDTLWVSGGTVSDLLDMNDIEVSESDILNYPTDEPLASGMTVELVNVDYVFSNETVSVPYASQTVYSTYLTKGSTKVEKGSNGQKVITYRQKLVNGVASEKVVVSEKLVKSAVNEVVYVGTKSTSTPAPAKPTVTPTATKVADPSKWASTLRPSSEILLDASGAPVKYSKLITGVASAYSSADGRSCASGLVKYLVPGCVAVNPKNIPYGSKLYITTADGKYIYGYAIAVDTGGFVTMYPDRVVDLFFDYEYQANAFGLQNIKIYVLE